MQRAERRFVKSNLLVLSERVLRRGCLQDPKGSPRPYGPLRQQAQVPAI